MVLKRGISIKNVLYQPLQNNKLFWNTVLKIEKDGKLLQRSKNKLPEIFFSLILFGPGINFFLKKELFNRVKSILLHNNNFFNELTLPIESSLKFTIITNL
jgi:hypothetical protein